MQVEDCLEMLRMIKDVAFATVDRNGLPQVRGSFTVKSLKISQSAD